MSRSKTSKVKKKTPVKTKQATVNVTSASMEKDFKNLPKKLIAQIRKEVVALKKDEATQQVMLKKAQLLKKATNDKQDRIHAKANGNLTATVKKQLNATKKEQMHVNKTISQLNKQIETIKKNILQLSNKNAKFTELSKQIAKLEKDVDAKIQKTPKKLPTINKKAKKKSSAKTINAQAMQPVQESTHESAMTELTAEPIES